MRNFRYEITDNFMTIRYGKGIQNDIYAQVCQFEVA